MNDGRICLLLLCICVCIATHCEAISPIILVPGYGGSQLENKDSTGSWKLLWANSQYASNIEKFIDIAELQYDPITRTTHNAPGVEIRVPGFGETTSVEYITRTGDLVQIPYFYELVDFLCRTLGYVRGVSVRAAPYDFRKAANEMGDYFTSLKQLVEETYNKNNKQRVVLLCHSMGGLTTLYFLNHQTQAWKDTYIKSFISIGTPYGGVVNFLRNAISGYDPTKGNLDAHALRRFYRSTPSTAWLLPYDSFWNKDEVLVYGPTKNYTVGDYQKLFNDIGYKNGLLMREDTQGLTNKLEAPGVQVHCLHGSGLDTPSALNYMRDILFSTLFDREWYDADPENVLGDGDGYVNLRSLQGCLRWPNVQHRQFPSVNHFDSASDDAVLQYIAQAVSN